MSELPSRTQTSISLKIASRNHKTRKTLSDWFTYVYSEVPDFGTTHKICKILRVELDEENLVMLCEVEKPVPIGVLLRAAQIKPTQTVAAKMICDTVYMSDLLLSEKSTRFFIDQQLNESIVIIRYQASRTLIMPCVDLIQMLSPWITPSFVDVKRLFIASCMGLSKSSVRRANTAAVLDTMSIANSAHSAVAHLTSNTLTILKDLPFLRKTLTNTTEAMGFVAEEVLRKFIVEKISLSMSNRKFDSLITLIGFVQEYLEVQDEEAKEAHLKIIKMLIGDFEGFEAAQRGSTSWEEVSCFHFLNSYLHFSLTRFLV